MQLLLRGYTASDDVFREFARWKRRTSVLSGELGRSKRKLAALYAGIFQDQIGTVHASLATVSQLVKP